MIMYKQYKRRLCGNGSTILHVDISMLYNNSCKFLTDVTRVSNMPWRFPFVTKWSCEVRFISYQARSNFILSAFMLSAF